MLPWLDFGDNLPCFKTGLHGSLPISHGHSPLENASGNGLKVSFNRRWKSQCRNRPDTPRHRKRPEIGAALIDLEA